MKKYDLAYLAGIFDGEGCIVIHDRTYKHKDGRVAKHAYVEVSLGNTNEWICRQFLFSFGGNCYLRKKQAEMQQQIWAWQAAARIACEFLEVMLPHLRLKKAQAQIALNFGKNKMKPRINKYLTDEEMAVTEATKILISNLNKGKKPDEGK